MEERASKRIDALPRWDASSRKVKVWGAPTALLVGEAAPEIL
jgi:hypothetical protein